MRFFFDNCISPKIVKALASLDLDVIHLQDVFPADTKDTDWLPVVGQNGWSLITIDRRIRSRPHERAAREQAKVTCFFLGRFFSKKGFTPLEQTAWLLLHWKNFEQAASLFPAGVCVAVQQNGKMPPL